MKKEKFAVIDYGIGNLGSVIRALNYLNFNFKVIFNPKNLQAFDGYILPGVGAFGDGIAHLRKRGFEDSLKAYVQKGRPLLGICLGMQLLMTRSFEFGTHEGLNLIPGEVKRLDVSSECKIPHIGWNQLKPPSSIENDNFWKNTLLHSINPNSEVYFVHSFVVCPNAKSHILAATSYGQNDFCSVIQKDNIVGCQFHPEKSGKIGLNILKNIFKYF